MTNYKQTAIAICNKIVDVANSIDDIKRFSTPLALDVYLDGTSYEATVIVPDTKMYGIGSKPEDYAGDSEIIENVQLEDLAFPCKNFSITNNVATFECMDPMDMAAAIKCVTIGEIAQIIQAAGLELIEKANIKMYTRAEAEVAGIQNCEYCDIVEDTLHNGKKIFCLSYVELDKILDLDYTSTVEKIAQQQYNNEIDYSSSMKNLGKHFYEDDNVDECDGGASAGGGDAGGDAASVAGDANVAADSGDTAAEMAGTTTADVLGKCEPGKGYMGKDNFYIPARAKCPLHHWEIANGGSKRKKKGKYPYEKGMKVVVSMFEDEMINEDEGFASYENLHNADWEDIKTIAKEKAIARAENQGIRFDKFAFEKSLDALYDRWQAAQFDPPDIVAHGAIGACTIDDDKFKRDYLSEYFIHGLYKDGTMFEIGPMKRKVASAYISLHKLSINSKAFQNMKDTQFSGIKEIGTYDLKNKVPLTIVKFSDGYWLYSPETRFKAGPFENKQLARMYAVANKYAMEKNSPSDKVEQSDRLEYPTFAFSYTMAGVPCMDIVVAEDINRAMKLFDFQWRVFDNTRPVKQMFNNIGDLQRDLALLRIKDIEIEELDASNVDEYVELAQTTGNPSTIPQLKSRCRNPKFRYILGRDGKTGRSLVKIEW